MSAPANHSKNGQVMFPWASAAEPWVLHSAGLLGNLTDGWIDLQARSRVAYDSRLLGSAIESGIARQPHWLLTTDRPDLAVAAKAMYLGAGRSLRWVARPFADNPPAVVHAHYGTVASQHRFLARRLGAALVASFYGFDATSRAITQSHRWRRRFSSLFSEVDAVVVEGPAMAERVAALGCPTEKLHIVRLPANADVLERIERKEQSIFTVVAPGWFNEKKGHDVAIRSFARALRGREARLVMLGGGDREPELRRLASEERVASQVVWPGLLQFDRFSLELASASVAVYPSREAVDGDSDGGAPVTLIESQWIGVPSLVSDHDDLPFVAPTGSIILPSTDVDAWASALLELYENRSRIGEMGIQAREHVRANHSPAVNAINREAVYASLHGPRG